MKHVSLSLATMLAIQLCGMATGVVTTRLLGPGGKGELTAVLVWPTMLQAVVGFGLVSSVTYHAAVTVGSSRGSALVGNALVAAVAQALLLVAVGSVAIPAALASYGPTTIYAARVYVLVMGADVLSGYLLSVLNGGLYFGWYNALRFGATFGQALAVVGLAAAGQLTILNVVLATGVMAALGLAAAGFKLWRVGLVSPQIDPALLRDMIAYGAKVYPGLLGDVINARVDQLIISVMLPPSALGLYGVAVALTAGVGLIGRGFSIVVLPSTARADTAQRRLVVKRLTCSGLVASSVAAVVCAPLVLPFIGLFFGASFRPSANSAYILVIAAIFLNLNQILSAVLKALALPFSSSKAQLASLVITVVGLALLLPPLGIVGAALTSLFAYAATSVMLVIMTCRALQTTAAELLIPTRADLMYARDIVLQTLRVAYFRSTARLRVAGNADRSNYT